MAQLLVSELDYNCRMGEEPYEIELDVKSAAQQIGQQFALYMESNPPSFMPPAIPNYMPCKEELDGGTLDPEAQRSVYAMHIEILFNFIYLFSGKRTRSITRYSERLLEQMLIESSQEMGFSEVLHIPCFYGNFAAAFTFLELLGLEVHASLRIKQLRAIESRMRECDTKQFAFN
jgi:hypothetical protein